MADGGTTPQLVEDFITHWEKAEASERANAQPFLIGLAKILGVPEPSNSHADGYTFEFPVKISTGPDTSTEGRIDLYRRASFVLEAKQFAAVKEEPTELALALDPAAGKRKAGPVRGSEAWDDAMWKARGQAERYARHLPADEPPAPFLLVVDVGHSIEVYADFTPKEGFRGLLESLRGHPEGFGPKLRQLFAEMQTGTDFSVILNKKLLRFNGGLFEDATSPEIIVFSWQSAVALLRA